MKEKNLLLYITIPILLIGSMMTSAHAEKHEPPSLWWDATVRGSERYPGGTVYLESLFIDAGLNTSSYILSIDTISWTTPWETYVETKTPVFLYPGDGFYSIIEVKIPDTQPTGNTSLMLRVDWRYRPTWERPWYAGNAILNKTILVILPNPYILQEQINSLNITYEKLMAGYKSLNSSFNSLERSYNSLNASYNKLKTDYDSLQKSYNSLKDDRDKLESDYNRSKTELESTTTQLKGKTAELNTNTNLMYVSIIMTIAFITTTVYFARRKPGTT
jgi:hypothetical protein